MKQLQALLRFAAAVLGGIAIVVTAQSSVAAGTFDPTRFFGYFTIQGNGILAIVLLVAAIAGITGSKQSRAFLFVRASATTYMVIIGLVYNTLLRDADVGIMTPWANSALHLWLPIYAAVDWLLFADRPAMRWKLLPLTLVYPLLWTGATVVRGAIESPNPFFPYPFLNPANVGGYGGVALYVLGIAVAFTAAAALVWIVSRVKLLRT
jgi:hypothetical protein